VIAPRLAALRARSAAALVDPEQVEVIRLPALMVEAGELVGLDPLDRELLASSAHHAASPSTTAARRDPPAFGPR
jgi:hypothetical protein